MYSRAERKFLAPDKDHANPNLGPGCYTADGSFLIAGKLVGIDGYAPFASLTPRISYFDELVGSGPAPGAYDGTIGVSVTHRKDPAATFGRSRTHRFQKIVNFTPGPGTYRIPTSIAANTHARGGPKINLGLSHFSLTQQPVVIDYGQQEIVSEHQQMPRQIQPRSHQNRSQHDISGPPALPPSAEPSIAFAQNQSIQDNVPEFPKFKEMPNSFIQVDLPSASAPPPSGTINAQPIMYIGGESPLSHDGLIDRNIEDIGEVLSSNEMQSTSLSGPEARGLSLVSRDMSVNATEAKERRSISNQNRNQFQTHPSAYKKPPMHAGASRIIWKRKYVPPSIPAGRYAFGYQENTDGDLVPRKPPKRIVDEEPAYLTSFAEKAKHEARGCRFAKGGERLSYKIIESPGPNKYNPLAGDQYLSAKSAVSGPAMMTLAPCKRLTDEIVADSIKKGIPGPGAYDIKAPLAEKIDQPRNRIRFGSNVDERSYLNPELMKTPGPGAYYPEFSDHPKPHSHKPQPFGSSTRRFDMYHPFKSNAAPAVGTYDIDESTSIFKNVKDRANYISLRPAAFGSVAERFMPKKQIHAPGPGAYEVTSKKEDPSRATDIKLSIKHHSDKRKEQNRLQKLLSRGPAHLVLGNIQLPAAKVHVPIFGTQTERFAEHDTDLPPPGAYDIANSFQLMRTKGRIENTGVLASQSKRELFPIRNHVPGPGEYDPAATEKSDLHEKNGPFLSTSPRFQEKYERVPGPGAYLPPDYENGLVKKTYNITLTDWGREHVVQS